MKKLICRVCVFGVVVCLTGCSQAQPKVATISPLIKPLPVVCQDQNSSTDTYDAPLPQENEAEISPSVKKANDIDYYPQALSPYLDHNFTDQEIPSELQKHFEEHYYAPWSYSAAPICVKEAKWPIGAFSRGYGSNLNRVDSAWISELIEQSNFEAFSTVNKHAVMTKWMNLRVYPTQKPMYKNPALPGDGYPFDLFQNSSVSFNEPVFVSHYSKDGSWVYVFTNNASGWVESDGIAVITPAQIALIHEKEKVFISQDKVPLYDGSKKFVCYSRIGMVLPLKEETTEGYKVLFVTSNGDVKEMLIPKEVAYRGWHLLNKQDLIKVGSNILKNTYGWGGMYEERDCSSTIRELLTPFGIWLPRNSASQAKKGEVISFNGLDNTQRIALIKEKAVPFETIMYKKGHVLLYIGTYEDNVMVLHNMWGIRTIDSTGKKGKIVVGKAVITTLELGKEIENFDTKSMLVSTLVSMNIFTHPAPAVVRTKKKEGLSRL